MEHTAGLVQGIRGTPAPMVKFLPGASAALVESITGKVYDVEGINDTPKPAHHSYALKREESAILLLLACPTQARR